VNHGEGVLLIAEGIVLALLAIGAFCVGVVLLLRFLSFVVRKLP
jgi:hypothetical protein